MRHRIIKRVKWKKNASDFCSHVWYAGKRGKQRFVLSKNPVYTKSATFDMPGSGANHVLHYPKSLLIQSYIGYRLLKNSDLVTKDMQPSEDMSTLSYEDISSNFLFFSSIIFLFVHSVDSICSLIPSSQGCLPRKSSFITKHFCSKYSLHFRGVLNKVSHGYALSWGPTPYP